jgi:hypothetical protein
MKQAPTISNPHIPKPGTSQFEGLAKCLGWRVASNDRVTASANGADLEHGRPWFRVLIVGCADDTLSNKPENRSTVARLNESGVCPSSYRSKIAGEVGLPGPEFRTPYV